MNYFIIKTILRNYFEIKSTQISNKERMCRINLKPLFNCRILIRVKEDEQHNQGREQKCFESGIGKKSCLQGHQKDWAG